MKKKTLLIFLSLAVFFSFISCVSKSYKRQNLNSSIKEKTVLKDFSSVNDPIVLTFPIYDEAYMMNNKDLGVRRIYDGNVFYVFDWENNKVFDWCYSPKGDHISARCLEIGENPKTYVSAQADSYVTITTKGGKVKVHDVNSENHISTMSFKNYGNYIPLETYSFNEDGSYTYNYHFVNDENKFPGITVPFKTSSIALVVLTPEKNGNLWLDNFLNDKYQILRFDPSKGSVEEWKSFSANVRKEGEYKKDCYRVLCVEDGYLLLTKYLVGGTLEEKLQSNKNTTVDIYDINTKELVKSIPIKLPYQNSNSGFINKAFKIGEYFYVITYGNDNDQGKALSIWKINKDGYTEEVLPRSKIFANDNFYVRGSRIYLIDSYNATEVTYYYFDTKDNKVTGPFTLNPEIICATK